MQKKRPWGKKAWEDVEKEEKEISAAPSPIPTVWGGKWNILWMVTKGTWLSVLKHDQKWWCLTWQYPSATDKLCSTLSSGRGDSPLHSRLVRGVFPPQAGNTTGQWHCWGFAPEPRGPPWSWAVLWLMDSAQEHPGRSMGLPCPGEDCNHQTPSTLLLEQWIISCTAPGGASRSWVSEQPPLP